jgi:hypothetical protein
MSDLRKAAETAWNYFRNAEDVTVEGKQVMEALRQALAQPEQYDQTALELCKKCGWKAIIPDEGCLVCARNEHEPYVYVGSEHKGYREVFPLYRAPPSIEAAVLAEREACAKLCEVEATVIVTNASEQYQEGRSMGATVCAAAIRARSEK